MKAVSKMSWFLNCSCCYNVLGSSWRLRLVCNWYVVWRFGNNSRKIRRYTKNEGVFDVSFFSHPLCRMYAFVFCRKSTFDMFDFLASQHRKLPEYTVLDEEEDDLPLKSTRLEFKPFRQLLALSFDQPLVLSCTNAFRSVHIYPHTRTDHFLSAATLKFCVCCLALLIVALNHVTL